MTQERLDEISNMRRIPCSSPEWDEICTLARRALVNPPMTAEDKAVVEAAELAVHSGVLNHSTACDLIPCASWSRIYQSVTALRASRVPKKRYRRAETSICDIEDTETRLILTTGAILALLNAAEEK